MWHHSPKKNCEAKGNVKIIEKGWEPAQIIRSGFQKKYSIIGKPDQADEGQIVQFTPRGDLWPNCPIKSEKWKYWNIDLN